MKRKVICKTFYDDFKLKPPLVSMVYTEIFSASSVKTTTVMSGGQWVDVKTSIDIFFVLWTGNKNYISKLNAPDIVLILEIAINFFKRSK